jgi:Uncharacterized protein conserved in bacteria (DUF2066)
MTLGSNRVRAAGLLQAVLASALLFAPGGPVAAASRNAGAFTVANFPVEARGKNAVAAKKTAISDGQSAALRSLLKRIVPVTAYGRLRQMGEVDAAQYVNGISVRGEQNSSTEYYASLDFAFSPDGVRGLLRERGVPFIDEQAPSVLLIPVLIGALGAPERSAGTWGEVWGGLDLENSVTPLTVVPLRPNIHPDVFNGLAQRDEARGMRILAAEYGRRQVVVVQAEVDRSTNRLKVRIDGRDSVGPVNWSRTYRIYDGDAAYAMELAAVVTLGVLEGRWKALKARQSGGIGALTQPAAPVRIEVLFNNARDWYRLQRELAELSGVEAFRVGAVSARSANVSLSFPGGGGGLANVLARQGLSLDNAGDRWVLRQRF